MRQQRMGNLKSRCRFRLKCMGCGHQIMVPRKMVEKNTKNLQKKEK